jgi:hypothetical protein
MGVVAWCVAVLVAGAGVARGDGGATFTLSPRLDAPVEVVVFRSQGRTTGGQPGPLGTGRAGGVIERVGEDGGAAVVRWTPKLEDAVAEVERAGASPGALVSTAAVTAIHGFGLEFALSPEGTAAEGCVVPMVRNHAALYERMTGALERYGERRGADRPTMTQASELLRRLHADAKASSAAIMLDQQRFFALVRVAIPVEGGSAGEKLLDLGRPDLAIVAKGRWEIVEGDPKGGVVRVRLTWRADLGTRTWEGKELPSAEAVMAVIAPMMRKLVPQGEKLGEAIRGFRVVDTYEVRFDLGAMSIDWMKFDRSVRALGEQMSEQQVFRRAGVGPQPGDPDEVKNQAKTSE